MLEFLLSVSKLLSVFEGIWSYLRRWKAKLEKEKRRLLYPFAAELYDLSAPRFVEPRLRAWNDKDSPSELAFGLLDRFLRKIEYRHLVITGETGTGKSTLLVNYFFRCSKLFRSPVRFMKFYLVAFDDLSAADFIKEKVPDDTRTTLLIDGLDLDPRSLSIDRFRSLLKKEGGRLRNLVIAVPPDLVEGHAAEGLIDTGIKKVGPLDLERPNWQARVLQICPLEDEQISFYLRKAVPKKRERSAVHRYLETAPDLKRTALFLKFLVDFRGESSSNRAAVYDELFRRLCLRKELHHRLVDDLLREVATEIIVSSLKTKKRSLTEWELEKLLKKIPDIEGDASKILAELRRASVLIREQGTHEWCFYHKSMLEYFAAKEYRDQNPRLFYNAPPEGVLSFAENSLSHRTGRLAEAMERLPSHLDSGIITLYLVANPKFPLPFDYIASDKTPEEAETGSRLSGRSLEREAQDMEAAGICYEIDSYAWREGYFINKAKGRLLYFHELIGKEIRRQRAADLARDQNARTYLQRVIARQTTRDKFAGHPDRFMLDFEHLRELVWDQQCIFDARGLPKHTVLEQAKGCFLLLQNPKGDREWAQQERDLDDGKKHVDRPRFDLTPELPLGIGDRAFFAIQTGLPKKKLRAYDADPVATLAANFDITRSPNVNSILISLAREQEVAPRFLHLQYFNENGEVVCEVLVRVVQGNFFVYDLLDFCCPGEEVSVQARFFGTSPNEAAGLPTGTWGGGDLVLSVKVLALDHQSVLCGLFENAFGKCNLEGLVEWQDAQASTKREQAIVGINRAQLHGLEGDQDARIDLLMVAKDMLAPDDPIRPGVELDLINSGVPRHAVS